MGGQKIFFACSARKIAPPPLSKPWRRPCTVIGGVFSLLSHCWTDLAKIQCVSHFGNDTPRGAESVLFLRSTVVDTAFLWQTLFYSRSLVVLWTSWDFIWDLPSNNLKENGNLIWLNDLNLFLTDLRFECESWFEVCPSLLVNNIHYQSQLLSDYCINPWESRGNCNATSNNTKLVHWPLMGGLLHLVQRGGAWADWGPAQSPPRCTKCNSPPINDQCTNHRIFVVYNSPLLCVFNVAMKGQDA